MGYNLEDAMPTQPHTYKKFIEKHAQSTQKDLKSSPKDSQNGPKTVLFGLRGAHWTLRGKDVSKTTPK